MRQNKWMQILVGVDQLYNALASGWADETISARSYRCKDKSKKWFYAMKFIDILFFWEPDHCYKAYLSEQNRHQLPAEYRGEVK